MHNYQLKQIYENEKVFFKWFHELILEDRVEEELRKFLNYCNTLERERK